MADKGSSKSGDSKDGGKVTNGAGASAAWLKDCDDRKLGPRK
jgi:hypothetical protein